MANLARFLIVIIFTSVHGYGGREGSRATVRFKKNVIHGALRFCEGVSKPTFSMYSSGRDGGRGPQKRVLCVRSNYNVDNSGRTLYLIWGETD